MQNLETRTIDYIKSKIIKSLTHVLNLDEWCNEALIDRDDLESIFELAKKQSQQLAWLEQHRKEGYEITNTSAGIKKLALDADKTQLVMEIPASLSHDVLSIQPLVGQTVKVELYPINMPLPFKAEEEQEETLPF